MTKYKQTLIDEKTYNLVRRAKEGLREKYGRPFSIADAITHYIKGGLALDGIPDSVSHYISEFVSQMSMDQRVLGLALFGSYARGEQTKYSDIDVFLVFDGRRVDAHKLISSVDKELEQFREPILAE